jgi:hypothetical protein
MLGGYVSAAPVRGWMALTGGSGLSIRDAALRSRPNSSMACRNLNFGVGLAVHAIVRPLQARGTLREVAALSRFML